MLLKKKKSLIYLVTQKLIIYISREQFPVLAHTQKKIGVTVSKYSQSSKYSQKSHLLVASDLDDNIEVSSVL